MTRIGIFITATLALVSGLALWNWTSNLYEQDTKSLIHEEMSPYVFENEGFKIMFPMPPQNVKDTIVEPETEEVKHYSTYLSQNAKGTFFVVNVISYPNYEGDLKDKMNQLLELMVKMDPQNSIVEKDQQDFQGYPSIRYLIKGPNKSITAQAMEINDKVYLISTMSLSNQYDPNEFDIFLNSFQLIPEE
ncbi:MAG: hypothetical protein WDZ27_00650 [Waddliaceae bacterium]